MESLLGFFDVVTPETTIVKYAVMNEAIDRGETKPATVWAGDTPAATTEIVDLSLDWLSPVGEPISTGKEVAYVEREGVLSILWAACEEFPPEPPQQGD